MAPSLTPKRAVITDGPLQSHLHFPSTSSTAANLVTNQRVNGHRGWPGFELAATAPSADHCICYTWGQRVCQSSCRCLPDQFKQPRVLALVANGKLPLIDYILPCSPC